MSHPVTPARALGTTTDAGYRLLRDVGSSYTDGGEQAVLDIIRETAAPEGLRSESTALVQHATTWATRYHTDPARANVVRALDLPATARVLEVGAGCGAVTRYLAETCEAVDALEPVPIRAAAAAARTRDLASAQVLVGELDDVPAEATYDVVVVIGVLEYVGAGSADREPYLTFLRQIRRRLKDTGTLVLAIENKLGAKYLVGAPEDHTNKAFDSIEGYPAGGRARTFSRRELQALLTDAGFADATTKIAVPDYKMPRAIIGDLPESARSLWWRVPEYPSPDWRSKRPKIASEREVWRSFVEAGLAHEAGNSFVMLASASGTARSLWPEAQSGMFFTTNRVAGLNAVTVMDRVTADGKPSPRGGTVSLRRRHLGRRKTSRYDVPPGMDLVESTADFVAGTDLVELVADGGPNVLATHLAGWLALLDGVIADDSAAAFDVVPHNIVVAVSGEPRLIDVELTRAGTTRDEVIRRGVLYLAVRAAPLTTPGAPWDGCRTVRDMVLRLAAAATEADESLVEVLDPGGDWIAAAIETEADFLAAVRPRRAGVSPEEWREAARARTAKRVEKTLASMPLTNRLPERFARLQGREKALKERLATANRELAAAKRAAGAPRPARAARLRQRAMGAPRRMADRVLPVGTARRASASRVARTARRYVASVRRAVPGRQRRM